MAVSSGSLHADSLERNSKIRVSLGYAYAQLASSCCHSSRMKQGLQQREHKANETSCCGSPCIFLRSPL